MRPEESTAAAMANLSRQRAKDRAILINRICNAYRADPDLPLNQLARRFRVSDSMISDTLAAHGLRKKGPRGGNYGTMRSLL